MKVFFGFKWPTSDSMNIVEWPGGQLNPFSNLGMCLVVITGRNSSPEGFLCLILLVSEAPETQLKDLSWWVWHKTDGINMVGWTFSHLGPYKSQKLNSSGQNAS